MAGSLGSASSRAIRSETGGRRIPRRRRTPLAGWMPAVGNRALRIAGSERPSKARDLGAMGEAAWPPRAVLVGLGTYRLGFSRPSLAPVQGLVGVYSFELRRLRRCREARYPALREAPVHGDR